ncbi:MAG: LysR family transcriptional regulator, partial [Gammaproteobacteria bacterium]|nr:LysR family transcriptional regulator [Gammaproteobacteria bacterium]
MDIQNIQAFLSVSETGSFSRAADALFLTQPAISKRIRSLEQSLGVALFDRIGKSVRLTEA